MLTLSVLAVSLGLTLLFEFFFALCWGLRGKREFLIVFLVNLLTNPVVVTLYYSFPLARKLVLLLELGAVLAEWLCYRACSEKLRKPFLFALCVNAFSYGLGCIVNLL